MVLKVLGFLAGEGCLKCFLLMGGEQVNQIITQSIFIAVIKARKKKWE